MADRAGIDAHPRSARRALPAATLEITGNSGPVPAGRGVRKFRAGESPPAIAVPDGGAAK